MASDPYPAIRRIAFRALRERITNAPDWIRFDRLHHTFTVRPPPPSQPTKTTVPLPVTLTGVPTGAP